MEPYGIPGKRLVLPLALVILAGALVAVLYFVHEQGLGPVSADFTVVSPDANATILDAREVQRADKFLESHLDLARETGATNETVRLRVESMLESLRALCGETGTTFVVQWKDVTLRVEFHGFDVA
jgi:hypothetical protein